ncbi:MAG TPA: hypothetical protein VD816_12060 [Ohtaekwangia sp.]|nr:hypothetical protein [Ohtaekwangia sp.]
MPSDIINSILARVNRPDLVKVLSEDLSGSELNSVLLEILKLKAKGMTPPSLLNFYQQNRFVKPADLPVVETKRIEFEVLQLFEQHGFTPIELSPVSSLGSCSVVAPADQNKVLSALRGTEVLADSTNAIALHVSDLKQKNLLPDRVAKVCNIQRMVRTQAITGKGFTPHFRVGCLVSSGTDTGAFEFEKTALNEHLRMMKVLFLDYYKVEKIAFRLLYRAGYVSNFLKDVTDFLISNNPDTNITQVDLPEKQNAYYKGIQYKVDVAFNGSTYEIGDGGFVDWTQQLLQNKKERMLSTGFGFDFIYRVLRGEL